MYGEVLKYVTFLGTQFNGCIVDNICLLRDDCRPIRGVLVAQLNSTQLSADVYANLIRIPEHNTWRTYAPALKLFSHGIADLLGTSVGFAGDGRGSKGVLPAAVDEDSKGVLSSMCYLHSSSCYFYFCQINTLMAVPWPLCLGGRSMMLKAGLRKEHISMVNWMNSHGGRNGESIMMGEDLCLNGSSLKFMSLVFVFVFI